MFSREAKQRDQELRRQREAEIEMMKMARQEALEEEERRERVGRTEHTRAVSPGLEAARNLNVRGFQDEAAEKVEQLRLERIREIEEMKRAREQMVELDMEQPQYQRTEQNR